MWQESLSYNILIDRVDVKGDTLPDKSWENKLKDLAKKYIESRSKEWMSKSDLDLLTRDIQKLLERQDVERINLQEEFEKSRELILWWSKEKLWEQTMIANLQLKIYSSLWINPDLNLNSNIDKFKKGFVDGLILDNIETVKKIIEGWIESFLSVLREAFSVEWIKEFIKSIKEDIVNIGDILRKPYEWWVSVWWLWLWIFWKGLKWLKFFWKIDKVDDIPEWTDFWALSKMTSWKLDYRKVFDASKYEIELINDPRKNLQSILKDFDPKEKFIVDRLNKMANEWVEARVWNINNMLDYMIAHPWDLLEMRKMVIEEWVGGIMWQINMLSGKWMLKVDAKQIANLKNLREKILIINNK